MKYYHFGHDFFGSFRKNLYLCTNENKNHMENKITLPNRYGYKVSLNKVYEETMGDESKEHIYKLSIEQKGDWIRFIYSEDATFEAGELTNGHIEAVDPSGGPFIALGKNADIYGHEYYVKAIDKVEDNIFITLK